MFDIVAKGGWVMYPLILCSIVALAIIAERFWSLQRKKIAPVSLVPQVWQWHKANTLDEKHLEALGNTSPLGKILAVGLMNRQHSRAIMKESIEEIGRQVVHELNRFLNTLSTIASIAPLLGLLGTVIGMIKVFGKLTSNSGDINLLSGDISEALVTTAAGLIVAIPSLIFYRYYKGKIDELVITMEEESLKIVDVMHGEREDNV